MKQRNGSSGPTPPQAPARKRAYRSPELREYGAVPILTQSVANNKSKDGGPNNIRT